MSQQNMQEQLKEVAQRIKSIREIFGFSVEEMAEKTDVTPEEYVEFESGTKDFSFTFIYKCAKSFQVDPTELLQGTSPTLTSYNITRKGGGLPITRLKGQVYKNLASMFKNKMAEPFWVKIPYNENGIMKTTTHAGQEFDIVMKKVLLR